MFTAMDHAGIGPTRVQIFMAIIDVPPANETTLRLWERKIEPKIQAVGKESCSAAAEMEKSATEGETPQSMHV